VMEQNYQMVVWSGKDSGPPGQPGIEFKN